MNDTGAATMKATSTAPVLSVEFRHFPLLVLIHYLYRGKSTLFITLTLDKVRNRVGDKNATAKKYRMGKYLISLSLVVS